MAKFVKLSMYLEFLIDRNYLNMISIVTNEKLVLNLMAKCMV